MAKDIGVTFTIKDNFSSQIDGIQSKTAGVKEAMEETSSSATSMGDAGQSGFGKIASGAASIAGAIGITKAVSAGFNMIKDSVGGAMDRIDTLDQFGRVIESMTGSADEAAKSIDNIKDMIEGTSMTTDVMASSIQGLVTGGMDLRKAEAATESWGNANAFYGDGSVESFERVTTALSKMNTKGKIDMNEINSLTAAGIPVMDIFADKTGQTAEEVANAFSSGEVSVEQFMDTMGDALDEGGEKLESVDGAMVDLGQSWGAVFSFIGSYASMGMAEVIKSIDGFLENNGLMTMREMIADFGESVFDAFSKVAEWVPIVGEKMMGLYELIRPGLEWLGEVAFPTISEMVQNMIEVITPGLEWMADEIFPRIVDVVNEIVEKFTEFYNFVADNWSTIGPIIENVGIAVGIMAGAFAVFKGVMFAVNVVTGIFSGIMAVLSSPVILVGLAITAVVAAGVALYRNWETVIKWTNKMYSKFKETSAFTILSGAFDAVSGAVESLVGFFTSAYDNFVKLKNALTNFSVPDWVSNIGGKIGGAYSKGKEILGFASGTNSVPYDMTANIHKGEMIIPARQSANLRKQGTTIHNIDKGGGRNAPSSGGGGVTVTGNTFNVRKESDIDAIANELARKLSATKLNMA